MKTNIKRGFYVAGFAVVSALFLNNTSTSWLDMKTPSADARFDFRYSGVVNTGNEAMPLVGQLSKDGSKLYFTSQNIRGNKQLFVMKRNTSGEAFDKATRVAGVGDIEGYDIVMPTLSGDDKTLVFVSSTDGTQKGNDLFIAEKIADGYSNIRSLSELNEPDKAESYPWISDDGLRVYFTKQKGSNIKFVHAERKSITDKFSAPKDLNISIPDINNNLSCYLSNDEKQIFILSGDRIYNATRKNIEDNFNEPIEIAAANNSGFMNGIAISDNTEEMYVFNSIGFRNTQVLKFENAAVKTSTKKSVEAKTFQLKK